MPPISKSGEWGVRGAQKKNKKQQKIDVNTKNNTWSMKNITKHIKKKRNKCGGGEWVWVWVSASACASARDT